MIYLPEILVAFGGSEQTIPYAIDYLENRHSGQCTDQRKLQFQRHDARFGIPAKSMHTILIGVA